MVKMQVQQFNNDGCLSYLVFCPKTKEAVIIDPTSPVETFVNAARKEELQVKYIIETHTHVDHASSAREAAEQLNAKVVMHENIQQRHLVEIADNIPESIVNIIKYNSQISVDILIKDKSILKLGGTEIFFHYTPGHAIDGICVQINHLLFTGDTLFVGQCGRTDLPGGSARDLYDSLHKRIGQLPDHIVVYPAHDYEGEINSALGYERIHNPFLKNQTVDEFVKFVSGFFPPLDESSNGKLQCAITKVISQDGQEGKATPLMSELCFHMEQYLRSAPKDWNAITNDELLSLLEQKAELLLVDVREPHELTELGYIEGAINIPLQQLPDNMEQLPKSKDQLIVVACRSGTRSAYGALYIRGYGYVNVKNLDYGMLGWIKNNYPILKS
ncbi:MAG: MBL fold metallo-hydrolase [Bacillota bacterium]|nr:MBL fold metallo-hydrolase [Bacillota bacterium]